MSPPNQIFELWVVLKIICFVLVPDPQLIGKNLFVLDPANAYSFFIVHLNQFFEGKMDMF